MKEKNPQFFMSMMDVPFSDEDFAVDHYEEQLRVHVLEPLHETYGIDISDKAIRAAIKDHNEISPHHHRRSATCARRPTPSSRAMNFHVLQLVSQVCPATSASCRTSSRRSPSSSAASRDAQPWFRVRLVVTGSEIDDPAFTKLIRGTAARWVVADRYLLTAVCPAASRSKFSTGETPLRAVARHYPAHEPVPALLWSARALTADAPMSATCAANTVPTACSTSR